MALKLAQGFLSVTILFLVIKVLFFGDPFNPGRADSISLYIMSFIQIIGIYFVAAGKKLNN